MQAALILAPPLLLMTPSKNLSKPLALPSRLSSSVSSRVSPVKASPEANESATVDYSSTISVFPAEACETIGGEACSADIYPEAKLNPEARNNAAMQASEAIDREYLEYDSPKTVFPAEACDDLGGAFCEPPYQKGVY